MKLTTTTQVSIDGVMQGPGVPVAGVAERGVFERDGWAYFDNEAGTVMDEIYQRADAFGARRLEGSVGSRAGPRKSGALVLSVKRSLVRLTLPDLCA
jgi:hypothetical protein